MARESIPLPRIPRERMDDVLRAVQQYLLDEGFFLTDYKGETVYKKGTGTAQAMQFVKVEQQGERLMLEAWLRAGMGKAYIGKEMALQGALGAIPKKILRDRVEKLQWVVSLVLSGNGPDGAADPSAGAFAQPKVPEAPKKEEPRVEPVKEAPKAASAAAANFCAECGAKLKPGAKFCTQCGAKV